MTTFRIKPAHFKKARSWCTALTMIGQAFKTVAIVI